jgi:hypothetical protein
MAEPRIMSPKEYGLSVGYAPGQSIEGAELAKFKAEYAKYRQEAMTSWQLRTDDQGRMVRANPTTGLVMTMTNAQGQPVMAGTQGSQDPYAAYMNPTGVSGADPAAADMTNSAAFAGVQPTAQGTGAGGQGTGNPIVPVNVNPAMQRTAGPAVPTGVTAAAPVATPAPTPVANRVRVTAAEFEQTYGRKVQPGTAFPYKDESNNVIAIIEVE